MKSDIGRGAIILVASGFICKFIGALFRLPLTNLIGIEGIGIFQMIMSVYSLLLIFVSSGITNSLSKLVSSSRASGQELRISSFYRYAIKFGLLLSLLFGLFFAFFSKQIASLQGIEKGYFSYLLLILLLPLGTMIGVFRGIFQGYENMTPTAISQVIEQLIKFIFGLLFAYLFGRFGSSQGVFGAFLGITMSEVLAFFYLLFVFKRRVKINAQKIDVKRDFYSAVLPLSFGSAILPLSNAIEALIITSLLSIAGLSRESATTLFGLQSGVVGAILHFPLIISLSVAIALLPKIAYLSSQEDLAGQREIISNSFNYMWFFLVPLVIGIISISKVLYPIIYPNTIKGYIDTAYQLTILGGIAVILSAIMQFLQSLLQAKGFFYHSMIFSIIGVLAKIGILLIFAPLSEIGIFAIPISNIVLNSIVCICILIKLGGLVKIDLFNFTLPLLSSFIMFMSVKLILSTLGGIFGLLTSVLFGGFIYLVIAMPITFDICKTLLTKLKFKR